MFERVTDDIFTTHRPQRFWHVETGTRMTVVRLSSGGLFVHCPVALDDATRAAVDALGEVRVVASTSLFHHLYAGDWMRAYPKALFCACPERPAKRPDLRFGQILGDEPHPIWKDDLDQIFFSARFEREVVFFHRASGTMITADALLNLRHHPSPITRASAMLMGNTAPGRGWVERFAVKDWRRGRREVDRILSWDIERIVLAHGDLVPERGWQTVRDAYSWLPARG